MGRALKETTLKTFSKCCPVSRISQEVEKQVTLMASHPHLPQQHTWLKQVQAKVELRRQRALVMLTLLSP